MRKRNKSVLKTLSLLFLSFFFPSICYSGGFSYRQPNQGGGGKHTQEFAKNKEKVELQNNLLAAEFIKQEYGVEGSDDTKVYYIPRPSFPDKVFQTECSEEYTKLFNNRKKFINLINNSATQDSSGITQIKREIETSIKDCINKIYKKYVEQLNPFIKTMRYKYAGETQSQGCKYPQILYLPHIYYVNNIKSFRGSNIADNFNELQKQLVSYNSFEEKCSKPLAQLQESFNEDRVCIGGLGGGYHKNYNMLKSYFEKQIQGKSCHEFREDFKKSFIDSSVFQNFANLPEKCKTLNSLSTVSRHCEDVLDKLDPPFPEKNPNNLFYQCSEEIGNAYKRCYGEPNKAQNDSQKILSLINQKSTELCETNGLAQANQAKQNCVQAINQCMSGCENAVNRFKEDFLQCFYLPDFSSQAYQALHTHTACRERIEELRDKFNKQAKKDPFKVTRSNFHSLKNANSSRNSTAHGLIEACSDPLDKNQIDKKINEMQVTCQNHKQQTPQQQQQQPDHLVDPATGDKDSSRSSQRDQKDGVQSTPFSYGKNNPFNFKGSSGLAGDDKNSSSDLQIDVPSSDSDSISKSLKDKDSVSADFEDSSSGSSQTDNPYGYPSLDSNSSKRGVASSMRYSSPTAGDLSSLIDSTKEDSQTLGSKVGKSIRSFLSTEAKYGIINEPSQSATASFLDWMNDKKTKTKKALLKTYDKMAGITREDFQERLHLNDETVDLFELQREMFLQACQTHNCSGSGASPDIQK